METSLSRGPNIALGKPAEQSSLSQWSTGPDEACKATSGVKTGAFAFHTSFEDKPWIRIDLGQLSKFDEVLVFNRMGYSERTQKLELRVSRDGKLWRTVYQHDGSSFNGNDGHPLSIDCSGTLARFVEIRLAEEKQALHLDQIEVYDRGDPVQPQFLPRDLTPIDTSGLTGPLPWDEIDDRIKLSFTENGRIPVRDWYLREVNTGTARPVWSTHSLLTSIAKATRREDMPVRGYDEHAIFDLYRVFDRYPVKDKHVLVVGSLMPWIECASLAFGAASVTTVEYNPPLCEYDGLRIISVADFAKEEKKYDVVVSYSSIEHDGLGRYGDPINPIGDLTTMRSITNLLQPGGLFYFGVPIGRDILYWNAHRVYGRFRFSMMMESWNIVDMIAQNKSIDDVFDVPLGRESQPWWVLNARG